MDPGSSNENPQPKSFDFNRSYPKSKSALLKVVQVIFSLIAILCAIFAPYWKSSSYASLYFFTIIFQWFMWSAIISYLLVLFNLHHRAWWKFVEFFYLGLASLVLFISSIVALTFAVNSSIVFAGVFGILTSLLFGIESFFSFRMWRESLLVPPVTEEQQLYL